MFPWRTAQIFLGTVWPSANWKRKGNRFTGKLSRWQSDPQEAANGEKTNRLSHSGWAADGDGFLTPGCLSTHKRRRNHESLKMVTARGRRAALSSHEQHSCWMSHLPLASAVPQQPFYSILTVRRFVEQREFKMTFKTLVSSDCRAMPSLYGGITVTGLTGLWKEPNLQGSVDPFMKMYIYLRTSHFIYNRVLLGPNI